MKKIILASQSLQRKSLMKALGIPFEVLAANINEKGIIESDQKLRAKFIAKAKASEILKNNPTAIIIAADTFTIFNGKVYEKPKNDVQAIKMLKEQSGQTGVCYSGFSYLDFENAIDFNDVAVTNITFRKLSNFEIENYVSQNPVITWSAAFCPAYPAGINLIASVNGSLSSFTNGLPMEMLIPLLKKSGVFNETS